MCYRAAPVSAAHEEGPEITMVTCVWSLRCSSMMAGYLLRSSIIRMELRGALVLPALPGGEHLTVHYPAGRLQQLSLPVEIKPSSECWLCSLRQEMLSTGDAATDGDATQSAEVQPEEQLDLWAPGSQLTRVSGVVLRWHMEHGTQTLPAAQYIEGLEAEIRSLKQQVNTSLGTVH